MATIKSYTDLQQSKMLAEILSPESADMYYKEWRLDTKSIHIAHVGTAGKVNLPCWSLAALLDVLPSATLDSSDNHRYRFYCMERYTEWYNNPIDACVAMIKRLNKLNLL